MSYVYHTLQSRSAANLLEAANRWLKPGWVAVEFGSERVGWFAWNYWISFRYRTPPPSPGKLTLTVVSEDQIMLQFVVDLPAKTEAEFDVVSRKVEITIAGLELEPQTVPVETLEVGPFNGQQGAAVTIAVFNVDDAGNVSLTPSELEAVLQDTFAPPSPGQIGLRCVGETVDTPA
jgi:hypothetical protein